MWNTDSIFHEKQEGRLCAQHCLNATLQGAYFTAVELSEIATHLDDEERSQMAANGLESPEYRRFINQPSENMDDTGYFSVQVISRALAQFSLELILLNSSESLAHRCRQDPTIPVSYIFHMENHWFCIRKFQDIWFNLNSLQNKPKFMSSLYLTEYIKQMEQDGYMVFIVSGLFPECKADRYPPKQTKSIPMTINSITSQGRRLIDNPSHSSVAGASGGGGGGEERDLEDALRIKIDDFINNKTPSIERTPTAQEIRERRLAFFANKPSTESSSVSSAIPSSSNIGSTLKK